MTPQEIREEALARILAAQAMGLVKPENILGVRIPDELWKLTLPRARELLEHERADLALRRRRGR